MQILDLRLTEHSFAGDLLGRTKQPELLQGLLSLAGVAWRARRQKVFDFVTTTKGLRVNVVDHEAAQFKFTTTIGTEAACFGENGSLFAKGKLRTHCATPPNTSARSIACASRHAAAGHALTVP